MVIEEIIKPLGNFDAIKDLKIALRYNDKVQSL